MHVAVRESASGTEWASRTIRPASPVLSYSYYVSNQSAGAFGRVAAPELEALVVDAVRRHLQADGTASKRVIETDRELIERHLLRATLSMTAITLHLRQDIGEAEACGPQD